MFNSKKLGNLSIRIRIKLQKDDVTSGFDTHTKLGFRIKTGKTAKEFRRSIINNIWLTKGYFHLAYFVETQKNNR